MMNDEIITVSDLLQPSTIEDKSMKEIVELLEKISEPKKIEFKTELSLKDIKFFVMLSIYDKFIRQNFRIRIPFISILRNEYNGISFIRDTEIIWKQISNVPP